MEASDNSKKRNTIKRSLARKTGKSSVLNVNNLLDFITPSKAVYGISYKPDLIIRRRLREMNRMISQPSMDYSLISQHASDILIAAKKALNEKNKKK